MNELPFSFDESSRSGYLQADASPKQKARFWALVEGRATLTDAERRVLEQDKRQWNERMRRMEKEREQARQHRIAVAPPAYGPPTLSVFDLVASDVEEIPACHGASLRQIEEAIHEAAHAVS